MFIIHVTDDTFRAVSDPLPAETAMKVAKAWHSHGDKAITIKSADGASVWSLSEFAKVA